METKHNSRILLIVLAASILCCGPVFSQDDDYSGGRIDIEDERTQFHLGLKAGLNLSNIYDTQAEDLSETFKVGFVGGLFFAIPLGPVFGIQPELLYSKKGYNGSGSISANSYEYTRTFDYIDVPVQLQIKPSESISLVAGPILSWLLNKRFSFEDGSITVEDQNALRNSTIRDFTIGVTGGLDVNVHPLVLSGRVGLDLRDNNGDGTTTNPRFKNVWIQATLGVIF